MKSSFIILIFVLFSAFAFGQPKQLSTAFQWLSLPTDSRSAGMAGAETALFGDLNALAGNPSRLAVLPSQHHVSFDFLSLPKISSKASKLAFRYALKNNNNSAIGCSVDYYTTGNIDLLNDYGAVLGSFKQFEYSIGLAYALKLSESSNIGVTLRYNHQSLMLGSGSNSQPVNGNIAGDIGFIKDFAFSDFENIRLGLSMRSLGPKVNGLYLPSKFSLGLSYSNGSYFPDKYSSSDFIYSGGIQIDKLLVPTIPTYDNAGNIISGKDPNNRTVFENIFSTWSDAPGGFSQNLKQLQYTAFSEVIWKKLYSLRAGYRYQNPQLGTMQHLAFGSGIAWEYDGSDYLVDIAYLVPVGKGSSVSPLSNLISLRFLIQFTKFKI